MVKQDKSTVVPRLRFPEFFGIGEWEYAPLGKLFSERQEAGFTDLPLLSLMDKEGIVPQDETNRKNNSSADKSKYLRVVRGDIAYNTMRMWEGRSAYVGIEGMVSPAYTVCAPAKGTYSPFFAFYFKTAPLIRLFRQFSQGLVKDTLNLKYQAFSRIEIAYPSDENEQKKIADCLASLDEVIVAQGRKVEALKTYKRGLMQQLFPREGENVPRLRFPEFRDGPEWKNLPLDQFIEEFREKSKMQDEYEVLTSARSGLIRQRDYYDNDRITERDNIGFNVIPPNYMTYRSRSDDRRFYFNENNLGITGIISTYYPVFRIRGGSNKFFIELLSHHAELVGKRSVGTSQTVLSLNELRRIKLPVPTNAEQQEIAGCLASLDEGITAESAKLESLKTHKKGLMQQLFPSPEEIL